jgi:glucarate dehydratase
LIRLQQPVWVGKHFIDGFSHLPTGGATHGPQLWQHFTVRIVDIRPTTVTVPLEAPLRHANGCHWGRFVRTIVEVETDSGLIGLGEMGGGGESAEAVFRSIKGYLVGHDPARIEEMRFRIANPTASLYNNRTQILAALEFACLDIIGQAWGVPVHAILGGKLRDSVPFASYCFFRYADPNTGLGEVRTIDQVVENARALKQKYGFTTHKVKGGVFAPDYELEAYRAVAAEFPQDRVRFDPNAVWSTEQAIRFGQAIEDLRNDYLEDPVFGLNGMRRARQMIRVPLATNTVVVNFEQLAANALDTAVDVVLLDTTFWGGIRSCVKAAGICETFQLGVAVHSSGELGVQLATMLHLGAVLPNLSFAADAHYHHLTDDVIEGGLMKYENGAIRVPDAPGLGVRLNRGKLAEYNELYKELGNYPYDQDPLRPAWAALVPNDRWADPRDDRTPDIAVRRRSARL